MKPWKFARRLFLGLMLTGSSALGLDFGARQAFNKRIDLPENHMEDARTVFGDAIDYSSVDISYGKISFLQSSAKIATIGNTIYCPKGMESALDYLMLHEMTHIWQQQNGIKGVIDLWREYPSYDDSYAYEIDTTKSLTDYNLEQQGEIVSDYFTLLQEMKKGPTREEFNRCSQLRQIIDRDLPQPELKKPAVFSTAKPMALQGISAAVKRLLPHLKK